MVYRKKTRTVLVAGNGHCRSRLTDAVADTDLELLHASTKQEAIELIELLRSEIAVAIIELELISATTSTYPELFSPKVQAFGIDAVVQTVMPAVGWVRTIEALLANEEDIL